MKPSPIRRPRAAPALPRSVPRTARTLVAWYAARVAVAVSRSVLRRGGGVIGGAVLQRLAPSAIPRLATGRPVVLVTGTNGKTTTTAMVAAVLDTRGAVATNADGANTPPGLIWTAATSGESDLVLEVDESWLPWAITTFAPGLVVLLNLTRDQLHRKPEVARVAEAWRQAIDESVQVVLNADQPAIVYAGGRAGKLHAVAAGSVWRADDVLCPSCGALLEYGSDQDWWCPDCRFSRPGSEVGVSDGALYVLGQKVGSYQALPGTANAGNAAHAVAAGRAFGVDPRDALVAIEQVHDVAGRYATVTVGAHRVRMILAKNPAGWQAATEMLRPEVPVLVSFTADGVDGIDASWLYDVDFEALRGRPVAITGSRAADMEVRLHLDDMQPGGCYGDTRSALASLPPGDVELVANYAAFQKARKELRHGR